MSIRIVISLIMISCFSSALFAGAETEAIDIKKKYINADDLGDQEQLLSQLIESYTAIDIDSALYYSDIYRSKFLINGSEEAFECNYYRLVGQIYKKQHNLILFLEQSSKALNCYKELDDIDKIAQAHLEFGIANAYQGKITEATSSFLKAENLYFETGDTLKATKCSMHLGTTRIMQGDQVKGLESYYKVLHYYEKIGYEEELGKLCNNIGLALIDLRKDTEALHYFQKGLNYSEKTEDKFVSSQILANIAGYYKKSEEYQLALGYLSKGLKLAEEINSDYSKSIFYYEIASTKYGIGKNYEALDAINQSLEIVKAMNNIDQIARSLVMKSNILLELSNYQEAHQACKECYEISKQTETLLTQRLALDCISTTANALKIYKDAYEYQKEYIAVNDSLQSLNSQEKLQTLEKETQYQKEKALLEQRNILNEALLREQKINTKFFALLSLLSFFGLGLLGFIYQSGKKYTARIKEKTKLIESTNEELSKLNNDLEVANSKLNNFTSVAAHDLKSPIRTMASYSQLLLMRNKDKLDEKDQEMLGFVSNSARRLTTMIDDLLSFSKIDENLGPTEIVVTNDIVEIIKNSLETVINDQNASVNIMQDLGTIKAHKSLVTQLFQNLIANGIKFRQENISPVIKIDKHAEDQKTITYSVADNGMGIPEKHHDKIFTIFNRLHSADEIEGSGIGLSTCKSIVDFYGHDIWLESEVGKGTTFFFKLPKK